jgi:hypothetical protein
LLQSALVSRHLDVKSVNSVSHFLPPTSASDALCTSRQIPLGSQHMPLRPNRLRPPFSFPQGFVPKAYPTVLSK